MKTHNVFLNLLFKPRTLYWSRYVVQNKIGIKGNIKHSNDIATKIQTIFL